MSDDKQTSSSGKAPASLVGATVNINPDTSAALSQKSAAARLPILTEPGPDSNFPDWDLVMTSYFDAVNMDYVIEKPMPAQPPASWVADNKTICAILTQTIVGSNLLIVRPYKKNAYGMWQALVRSHLDSSTGGRVYWLRKLLLTKMEGDDLLSHLNTMAKAYDRLNSLITPDKPLTPSDVHAAALLSSIPDDWMACVSHLMNQDGVKSESIVLALKNEHTRRQSQTDNVPSASSAKAGPRSDKRPGDRTKKPLHCDFCNVDGHDLNRCHNTRRILADVKASQKPRTSQRDDGVKKGSQSQPAARAGRTSAATLGQSSHTYEEDDESDYSGSQIDVVAGNAVAALSASSGSFAAGDANLDSGCSMSMTPDLDTVENPKPDRTPVRLADHSVVEATHKGTAKLPIEGGVKVKTLVVPSLHEPLLSIADMCDAGVTAVFTKSSCDLYRSDSTRITGTLSGRGYRRGNLYYLASEPLF